MLVHPARVPAAVSIANRGEASMKRLLSVLALSVLLLSRGTTQAGPAGERLASFGTLPPVTLEGARAQADAWFNQAIKDGSKRHAFEMIWEEPDRPLLDRVSDTLALEPTAARLLADARNPLVSAPTTVPAVLKDLAQPAFYRANLALLYGKALSLRRVYEEALATLKTVNPEDVVDPATYFFHRGVSEYALMQKDNARRSLNRLLDEVAEVPERYKTVGTLMLMDMLTWKDKDLDAVARLMDNAGRRLQLARGGPATQKIQKDIVHRLDELIKQKENQQKGSANGNGCPDGGKPPESRSGGDQTNNPMRESHQTHNGGPGQVDAKRYRQAVQRWGSMPEKDRRKFLQNLTRGMSDKHAQAIQNYFKKLVDDSGKKK
jgi:hypothetical protein